MRVEDAKKLKVGDVVCNCQYLHLKIISITEKPSTNFVFQLEGGSYCDPGCLDFVDNHTEKDHKQYLTNWVYRARRVLALHEIRVASNGKARTSDEGWSIRDTARECGISHTYAWQLYRVARLLDINPHLAALSWRKVRELAKSQNITNDLANL